MRKGHAAVLAIIILVALVSITIMWYAAGPSVGIPEISTGQAKLMRPQARFRCIDTDGGRVPDVKGIAKGLSVFPDEGVTKKADYCIQKRNGEFALDNSARDPYLAGRVDKCGNDCGVMEYFCAERIVSDVINCPAGCKNGACVGAAAPVPQPTCRDTDGGKNYDVKGIINDGTNKFSDLCMDDQGNPQMSNLGEYYCDAAGSIIQLGYHCPNGCKDGACVAAATPTCKDSDGGKNYDVKSSVSYMNNPYGVQQEFDICDVGNVLIERVCNSPTEYTQNFERYTCPNGCRDGACVSAPQTACKCGLNNFNVGTPCDGKNIALGTRGAQYGCQDGTAFAADPTTSPCKLPSEWQADADNFCKGHCGGNCCKDTDGGKNYLVKGTTIGITRCVDQSQCMTQASATDICGGTPSGSPNSLQEYVCDLGIFRSVIFYDCPNGCKDGACVP